MIRSIAILILAVSLGSITIAQNTVENQIYNPKEYFYQPGDPYNVTAIGFASFILPGLGHMLVDEFSRGSAALIMCGACVSLYFLGSSNAIADLEADGSGKLGRGMMTFGLANAIGINIWSIANSVKVAKVKNMTYQKKRSLSVDFQFQPIFSNLSSFPKHSNTVGLCLHFSF